jgi:hypothetical protein
VTTKGNILAANHGRILPMNAHKKSAAPGRSDAFSDHMQRGNSLVLGRPGSDLLSQGLSHSTIGAEEFNGRVRDGIGFMLLARTTRPAKYKERSKRYRGSDRAQPSGLPRGTRTAFATRLLFRWIAGLNPPMTHEIMDTENESNQADRTISTGKLHALLHFHTRPINVVVFHGSQGNARFEVGFPLRCFQRLSRPYIAMQHCRWRDNCSTRGTFIPVLSY